MVYSFKEETTFPPQAGAAFPKSACRNSGLGGSRTEKKRRGSTNLSAAIPRPSNLKLVLQVPVCCTTSASHKTSHDGFIFLWKENSQKASKVCFSPYNSGSLCRLLGHWRAALMCTALLQQLSILLGNEEGIIHGAQRCRQCRHLCQTAMGGGGLMDLDSDEVLLMSAQRPPHGGKCGQIGSPGPEWRHDSHRLLLT